MTEVQWPSLCLPNLWTLLLPELTDFLLALFFGHDFSRHRTYSASGTVGRLAIGHAYEFVPAGCHLRHSELNDLACLRIYFLVVRVNSHNASVNQTDMSMLTNSRNRIFLNRFLDHHT